MIELGIIASSSSYLSNIDFNEEIKFANIAGAYIPDSRNTSIDSNITQFSSSSELINKSDAIVFIGEHNSFHCLIINALKNSKHVKILSPESYDSNTLDSFLKLAFEANVCISTCHQWLENSNISNGIHYITSPSLIEFKQSIGFKTNSEPYSFFKRKIFNAIYFSLKTLRSNPKKIYALGISTFTKTIDFINSSIEFDNGSIIRLQIGAIDTNEFTKCRIHQKNAIASFDLKNIESNIFFLNVFKDIDNQVFNKTKEEPQELFLKSTMEFIENIELNKYNNKAIEIACEAASLTEQILDKLKIRSEVKQLFAVE
jgi:hypothetical protein